ncbi:type IV toxin-antitoxin system AbiEi family antitoxin domain-containing protein [Draconibacterium sediminis]|uniref:Transcriptional regulator, AbiEi antitoxin, Type IV TA system n=1 Tax=Draconibacterium sediminis TaxID=1544798 RepID=A0A0D8J8M8_9BACT|nr:hypothetical protein [Draconibacterium sediminis]KJF43159.1 hypothetical protein LH29_17480 [Draconibacterium sediminis]
MNDNRTYSNIPMEMPVVREIIGDYLSPNNKISSMEQAGDIIRLRRGLYVANPQLSNQEISRELIANNLYGPSYVSCESALSYHGLIPERVYTTISSTFKRAKSYTTPLGEFEYITVPREYFPIGIEQIIVEDEYAFLMASPEKALCDLIISTAGLRFQSVKAAREYLLFDLRIELSEHNWNTEIISQCAEHRRKRRELHFLQEGLQNG